MRAESLKRQYIISVSAVSIVALICFPFSDWVGYKTVALILLFTVSVLAMRLSLYPILVAAVLSALVWDYFFIPPRFTLHISETEDNLMLAMYFTIALLHGILTARVRHFEKLAHQKEERANTLKLYDTLFSSLSHELRTPIATILAASDNLLLENASLTEGAKKELQLEINSAAERLNRLVENLMNMSRLDSGFIKPKLTWVDLNELLNTVVNQINYLKRTHPIVVQIPDNLPLVRLDYGLIEQVILNIVNNAILYTPVNTPITISADCKNKTVVIEVLDDGKGLPKDSVHFIFDKFYRSKNAQSGGVGLGLSIAKGFVEAHNGTIKAENQPGSGAKFIIQIPTEIHYLTTETDETAQYIGH